MITQDQTGFARSVDFATQPTIFLLFGAEGLIALTQIKAEVRSGN